MSTRRKTKAIIFTKCGEVVVDQIALPEMESSDVMVEIEYSSVSIGTERWCLMGKLRPPVSFPHLPGYQAAGIVREVGNRVENIEVGDRVFSSCTRPPNDWPGSCWGGHVECHIASEQNVIKLPASVSTYEGSGLLLAQVGFNGAIRPQLKKGDVVVVIGDGLVGQYAGQVFRYRGGHVIMSGHHTERLNTAMLCSADEVINSRVEDLTEYMHRKYPEGIQIATETASKNELIQTAIGLLQRNGQLALLGYYPEGECLIDTHWLGARETTAYFPSGSTRQRLERTLNLIEQGDLKIEELVTHELPFTDAKKVYKMILEKSSEFLGIVFKWK